MPFFIRNFGKSVDFVPPHGREDVPGSGVGDLPGNDKSCDAMSMSMRQRSIPLVRNKGKQWMIRKRHANVYPFVLALCDMHSRWREAAVLLSLTLVSRTSTISTLRITRWRGMSRTTYFIGD